MDIWKMDIEELKRIYAEESLELSNALLDGADWSALSEIRERIIRIGVAIDQRGQGHDSPVNPHRR